MILFPWQNNSEGETAASPKGSVLIHLLMYFCLGKVLENQVAVRPRTLDLRFAGDRYDTCVKGILAISLREWYPLRCTQVTVRIAPNVKGASFAVCRSARTYGSKNTHTRALRFRALLTDSDREVHFERMTMG